MVKITVKDGMGEVFGSFEGNTEESLGVQAQDAGIPIMFSCGVGACRTCLCKIEEGAQSIEKEAIGPQHIMTDENETLTCISGLKKDQKDDIVLTCENL